MPARWPQQQRLVAHLRDILRREFGCQDAWVIVSGGRCRLEIRLGTQRVTLIDDPEDAFWARFYQSVQRDRMSWGERIVQTQIWRRSAPDLIAVLTPYWQDRIGARSHPGGAPKHGA